MVVKRPLPPILLHITESASMLKNIHSKNNVPDPGRESSPTRSNYIEHRRLRSKEL